MQLKQKFSTGNRKKYKKAPFIIFQKLMYFLQGLMGF